MVTPRSTATWPSSRSEEHTSELQSRRDLVCRLLLEKKKHKQRQCRMTKTTLDVSTQSSTKWLPPPSDPSCSVTFFFIDPATTEIYTLSLHDALPIRTWPSS